MNRCLQTKYFHYLRSIMKKTVRILFLAALIFTVAGSFAVSCQKGGGEEDIDGASSGNRPHIEPEITAYRNTYTIRTDGTTISSKSSGYSFDVRAGAISFRSFTCYLVNKEEFHFYNDCNLTLHGGSTFTLLNGSYFGGHHVTLSGNGSITFKQRFINETNYNNLFSAAEGYSLTMSEKKEEENGLQSCTWTVKKTQ